MERFEGARVIVLSPNPVHEGHFVTPWGIYWSRRSITIILAYFESSDLYKRYFGYGNFIKITES